MIDSIAIVTLYDDTNLGNKLQNYALQQMCRRYAEKVKTLTYKEVFREIRWKGKLIATLGVPKKIAQQKRLIINRRKSIKEFSDKYLNIEKARNFKEYNEKITAEYDLFIVGSDQVWHNWNDSLEELEYFFLRFAPKEKRVCYAPSFGFDNVEEKWSAYYQKALSEFEYLSCREMSGCALIKQLTGKEAQHLPDPTMVLEKEEWDKIMKRPQYSIEKKYCLVYFLGGMTDKTKEIIEEYALNEGCQIIDVLDRQIPEYYFTKPDEFIYLVANAQMVFTNSFHGSVFSIIYHKNFRVFDRVDSGMEMMGNRIHTLISVFGLKKCLDISSLEEIDFSTVDSVLDGERKKAYLYLDTVIGSRI